MNILAADKKIDISPIISGVNGQLRKPEPFQDNYGHVFGHYTTISKNFEKPLYSSGHNFSDSVSKFFKTGLKHDLPYFVAAGVGALITGVVFSKSKKIAAFVKDTLPFLRAEMPRAEKLMSDYEGWAERYGAQMRQLLNIDHQSRAFVFEDKNSNILNTISKIKQKIIIPDKPEGAQTLMMVSSKKIKTMRKKISQDILALDPGSDLYIKALDEGYLDDNGVRIVKMTKDEFRLAEVYQNVAARRKRKGIKIKSGKSTGKESQPILLAEAENIISILRDSASKAEEITSVSSTADVTNTCNEFLKTINRSNNSTQLIKKRFSLPDILSRELSNLDVSFKAQENPLKVVEYYRSSNEPTNRLIVKRFMLDDIETQIGKAKKFRNEIEKWDLSKLTSSPETKTVFTQQDLNNHKSQINLIDEFVSALRTQLEKSGKIKSFNAKKTLKILLHESKILFEPTDYSLKNILQSDLAENHLQIIDMEAARQFNRAGNAQIKNPAHYLQELVSLEDKIDCLQKMVLGNHISPARYTDELRELRKASNSTFRLQVKSLESFFDKKIENLPQYFSEAMDKVERLKSSASKHASDFNFIISDPHFARRAKILQARCDILDAAIRRLESADTSKSLEMHYVLDNVKSMLQRDWNDFDSATILKSRFNLEPVTNPYPPISEDVSEHIQVSAQTKALFMEWRKKCRTPSFLVSALQKQGWVELPKRGSHHYFWKEGVGKIPIPIHTDAEGIAYGTLLNIFNQAGWSIHNFPTALL